MAVVILIAVVLFASLIGLYATRNDAAFQNVIKGIERNWDIRLSGYALPEQEQAKTEISEDKRRLNDVEQRYDTLRFLLSMTVVGLVILTLVAFAFYQLGLVQPLRRLEESCRALAEIDLKGHVWGLDRTDQFGSVARAISSIRQNTVAITDMIIESKTGQSRVQFEGSSAAIFNTLVSELKDSVATLKQQGLRLESLSIKSEEKIAHLSDVTVKQNQALETAISETRGQLSTLQGDWVNRIDATHARFTDLQGDWATKLDALFHQNNQVTIQAKNIAEQFTRDMNALREIAGVTSQRVMQTLQTMTASDKDMRKAAQQSLEASNTFGKQAADVSEKLLTATNLLRASGKVMQETTESTRQRLAEAVNSVAGHDAALRAFLGDTAEKTERITQILGDMAQNANSAKETVEQFDIRMGKFEDHCDSAFARIEDSSSVIGRVAGQMDEAHQMMQGSMEAMRGHSETLSRILTAIRDEYANFSEEWKASLSEAGPAISQLKNVSDDLHAQLKNEWATYAQQSHALLSSLESDVRGVNTRTARVVEDSEKLLAHFAAQGQRLNDGANHFDLQLGNLSSRLENAASLVIQSNDGLIQRTGAQIQDMHTAVQDMVQRLGILSQLTGTLGSVAGQLGQIVPTLGDAAHMARAGMPYMPTALGTDSEVIKKLEEVGERFTGTVTSLHGEFEGVRGQISRWVEMLTGGYKNMAAQIEGLDSQMTAKIAELEQRLTDKVTEKLNDASPPAPSPIHLGDELVPAMKLVHEGLERNYEANESLLNDLRKLQGDMHMMAEGVGQTASSLSQLGSFVESGFTRLREDMPHAVKVDASRVEQASAMLEALLQMMQGQSNSFVERLTGISSKLSDSIERIQGQKDVGGGFNPRANLDQLQQQIERIAAVLDVCAGASTSLAQTGSSDGGLTPDKSRALKQTVQAAMARLQSIAESIERLAPSEHTASEGQKLQS